MISTALMNEAGQMYAIATTERPIGPAAQLGQSESQTTEA